MKHEYFSALNEDEAKKYIGKTMEFADRSHIRSTEKWIKKKFNGNIDNNIPYPFKDHTNDVWQFMRTCPETFQPVKKVFEAWINIYSTNIAGCYHNSREEADKAASERRAACLHIKQGYEVKE